MSREKELRKRRRRPRAAIILLFACGLLAASLVWFQLGRQSTAEKQILSSKRYGFELAYPSAWRAEWMSREQSARLGVIAILQRRQPSAAIFIKIKKVQKVRSLEKTDAALDALLSKQLPGFQKISSKIFEIDNRPALRYAYTFKNPRKQLVVQEQIITVRRGQAYYLVLQTSPRDYRQVAGAFDGVVKNLTLER